MLFFYFLFFFALFFFMMEIIHNILAFDFKSIDDRIVSVVSHKYYIKQKKDIPNPYAYNRMSKKYFRLAQPWLIV